MLPQRLIETLVGLFLLFAIVSLTVLAFKVSGLTSLFPSDSYTISAAFDDIGGLKVRSPVKIGGVQIGEVTGVSLDPVTFKAVVSMRIESGVKDISDDSSASILTAGLLGDNYVAIAPMYSNTYLKNGDQLQFTHSAMVLEKLIGQFIYKMGGGDDAGQSKGEKNANP
ncbi:MAG: outer membrane lipid asymmetry maintenance protein MlaD [Gammaproteobacteria bacterium RIFCSPHIGHO2_12_FULL_45_12]|nr:MAG: outer membrane lipid asymmetry maintenance protein MlaD [Gammaproteobacteria bacterium RIFCSPHIGHO2_12_FULL_45_12]